MSTCLHPPGLQVPLLTSIPAANLQALLAGLAGIPAAQLRGLLAVLEDVSAAARQPALHLSV
jgi:hypothetical protein